MTWWGRLARRRMQTLRWSCPCGNISVRLSGPPLTGQRLSEVTAAIEDHLPAITCSRCGAYADSLPRRGSGGT